MRKGQQVSAKSPDVGDPLPLAMGFFPQRGESWTIGETPWHAYHSQWYLKRFHDTFQNLSL